MLFSTIILLTEHLSKFIDLYKSFVMNAGAAVYGSPGCHNSQNHNLNTN